MELTKQQTSILKGIAILMMVCLHLFYRSYEGLFTPLVFIGSKSLIFYVSLFCNCCVAIYCFCSGYGLYVGYTENKTKFNYKNKIRVLKLYINYWIVLVLFVFVLGSILHKFDYIGNWQKILLNITALDSSYNGAWWFFFTYLLLVCSSPLLFKWVDNSNKYILILYLFVIYTLAYVQRIKTPIVFDNVFLNWLLKQISLYGTSLFPFMLGTVFYKYRFFTQISNVFSRIKYRNAISIIGIIILIVIHGFIPSLYLAVFTGIIFIVLYNTIQYNTIQYNTIRSYILQ
jgi:hypothetical protein